MGIRARSQAGRAEVRVHRSRTWFSREPRGGATVTVPLFFFLPFPFRPRPFFFPFPFPFRRGRGVSGSLWETWDEDPNQVQSPTVEALSPRSPGTMLAHDPLVLCLEARAVSLVSPGQGQSYDLRSRITQLCDLRSKSFMFTICLQAEVAQPHG